MSARSLQIPDASRLRVALIASLALAAFGLAACGSDADPVASTSGSTDVSTSAVDTSETPTPTSSSPGVSSPDTPALSSTPTTSSVVPSATPTENSLLPPELVEMLERDDREVADTTPADTFLAGYAAREMPWRVGAKPGQVGTAAVPDRDQRFASLLVSLISTFNTARRDIERYFRQLDAWVPETMDSMLVWPEPGKYSSLYEPGRGVELPPAVNAVVLSSGDEHVAIVSADLYLPHEQFHRRVAHLVAAETGINRDRLFLMATHNHSTPHGIANAAGVWNLADEFDIRHWVYMSRLIADAIIEAWDTRQPAQVRTGRTDFESVQQNIVGPRTEELSPGGDAPAEPVWVGYPRDHIDPALTMVRVETRDATPAPIATLFVLGMHPETLPDGHGITTGEFPRHVERKFAERTGGPAMWLTGALGDVEPDRENARPGADFWRNGFEAMDRMTDLIADAVVDLYTSIGNVPAETEPTLLNLARAVPGPQDHLLPRATYVGPNYPMLRVMLDASHIRFHMVRIHDVLLAGGPGEFPADMSFNLRSRLETGATPEDVFQGYIFEDNPAWVAERVQQNFGTNVASADAQVPFVALISLVNAYSGYVVTRWEFENREHYRQSLTTYGPDTAEHMTGWLISLAEEMHGAAPREDAFPEWYARDMSGFDNLTLWLREAENEVPDMAREVPASDPAEVGTILAEPAFVDAVDNERDIFPAGITFSWRGGTNDVDLPRVTLERETSADQWETVTTGPGPDLWLFWENGDEWRAHWRNEAEDGVIYRFRVEGTYRSDTPGTSDVDPWFDPDGANAPYTVESGTIMRMTLDFQANP